MLLCYYERLSRYRGEDQTLCSGVRHLDLLQCSQHGLHLGGVASLRGNKAEKQDNDDSVISGSAALILGL